MQLHQNFIDPLPCQMTSAHRPPLTDPWPPTTAHRPPTTDFILVLSENYDIYSASGNRMIGRNGSGRGSTSGLLSSRRLTVAISLIATCLSVSCSFFSRKPTLERGREALVKAYSKGRLIEPRLCGGFQAGKYDPQSGGTLVDQASLEKAQDLILGEVGNRTDPTALLERGRLNLAMGRCQDALPLLKDASKGAPDAADAHNDLGACLLEMGKYEDALVEFDKAVAINPTMVEGRFNRGLCYGKMLLANSARSELNPFLSEERDQGWKEEVERRINELETPAPKSPSETVSELKEAQESGDRQRLGDILDHNFNLLIGYGLSGLVKTYLDSVAAGNAEAARDSLRQIKLVGDAFNAEKHDSIIVDAADYLEKLTKGEAAALLLPYNDYISAKGLLASYNAAGADNIFERCQKSFHERGALLWELFASGNLATAHYEAGRCADSITVLERILPQVQARRWPFLLARLYYQFGIDYSLLGQDSLAIEYFNKGLAVCHESGEPDAKTLQGISVPYWHLGDLDRALSSLRRSTVYSISVEPSAVDAANNYLNIADIYRQRGEHKLARSYADEGLNFAVNSGSDYLVADSSSFLAVEAAANGNLTGADRNLSLSFQALSKTGGIWHLYTEPLVLTRVGDVARQKGDLKSAIEAYSRAEAVAAAAEGDATLLIDPLRGRAKAYLASNQPQKARSDLLSAVRMIESRRSTIADKTDRVHYLDSTQDAFDLMISLDVSAPVNDTAEAFSMAERSRARALLDEISLLSRAAGPGNLSRMEAQSPARQASPLSLSGVQAGLPPEVALLEYSLSDSGLLIFAVRKAGVSVVHVDVPASAIATLVNDYVSKLKAKAPLDELTPIAQLLNDYLIAPVEPVIRQSRYVCIVPDKSLHFLPFASLIDTAGKFLVERYTITYAPSATVFIESQKERSGNNEAAPEALVSVGDPSFVRNEFPLLAPLESAVREASTITQFYDSSASKLLTRGDATKAAVRSAMETSNVAHLAVHCLVDEKSPWLAELVLAPDNDAERSGHSAPPDDGLLRLSEIYRMKLPRTRLVVLSACHSALGQYYRGEGIVSLVHPFIAAHVPAVLATLWSVESAPTADLMIEFHRIRKLNPENTADALRDAQIQMAFGDQYKHPYYWAPFILVGSHR
jgi:CHAT domain-containing protein